MKIRKVSCEQFAGLSDFCREFGSGMNVVYGRNETGKSTLVSLIYRILFQSSAVGRKEAADKEFRARFYPAKLQEGESGDYAEGTLVFEADGGIYELQKKWGGAGSCRLAMKESKISNEDTIAQILESGQVLRYGRGIYDEIIFANQKNQYQALLSLLSENPVKSRKKDNPEGMKMELAALVSQAVMETGGISVEKLRKAIEQQIADAAYHWDEAAERPEKGRDIDNPWSLGEGKTAKKAHILRAYYEMRQYENEKQVIEKLEDELQEAAAADQQVFQKKQEAEAAYEELNAIKASLLRKNDLQRFIENTKAALKAQEAARENWPVCEERILQAQNLQAELASAQMQEKYERADRLQAELAQLEKKLEAFAGLDEAAAAKARALAGNINRFTAQLSGINLDARLKMLGDYEVEATAVSDGRRLDLMKEPHITEAVRIFIPDVMELQLSKAGVDFEQIRQELDAAEQQLGEILSDAHAKNVEDLQEKLEQKKELNRQKKERERSLLELLGEESYEESGARHALAAGAKRSRDEIESDIQALCGADRLDLYIGKLQGSIAHYAAGYGSMENLSEVIARSKTDIAEYGQELAAFFDIPQEYEQIANPKEELAARKKEKDRLAKEAEEKKKALLSRHAELEQFVHTADELQELIDEKRGEWEQEKEELAHWRHIQAVFTQMTEASGDAPVYDIAQRFRRNLETLTGDSLELAALDQQFAVQIYSKNRKMSFELLSEGTKGTIALAFRLAVIGHLYPEGNGLVVFDDPFTDMDKDRRAAACSLVQDFARNNQVIFATCDEQYAQLFGVEPILME